MAFNRICLLLIVLNIEFSKAEFSYKIGGLLPEIEYFNKVNRCFSGENVASDDALSAIQFAKERLYIYFKNYYNCNIDLDIKNIKVRIDPFVITVCLDF